MKKLPELRIKGNLDDLLIIETILIMMGYNKDKEEEEWNVSQFHNIEKYPSHLTGIICYGFLGSMNKACVGYYDVKDNYNFEATEIEKIISYIENYK